MNVEELRDDIDWFEKGVPMEGGASPAERMDRIVDAARSVADPSLQTSPELWVVMHETRPHDDDQLWRSRIVRRATHADVIAALTPGEPG